MSNKVSPELPEGTGTAKPKHPPIIYGLTVCATIGGALFGYDAAVINGANLLIKEQYHLTDAWIEYIVSSTVGAAAVFSLASGVIADAIGRKATKCSSRIDAKRLILSTAVINGSNLLINKQYHLSGAWIEFFVSSTVGTAADYEGVLSFLEIVSSHIEQDQENNVDALTPTTHIGLAAQ
ncbi:proton myo-inositol cotransporter [Plakobranchus ocellatus]|uniref:Proton myo-inositol cotransporter n=1 Tax=Plakobranchus ocellatus TaxID=259542 RepID=A0AAV3ZU70_9GAST|nr:proton myo-inositol cotransporter [Plakobranchus ocellatus]